MADAFEKFEEYLALLNAIQKGEKEKVKKYFKSHPTVNGLTEFEQSPDTSKDVRNKLATAFATHDYYKYQDVVDRAIGHMVSLYLVLFLISTCVSYTVFFTCINRLLTDSNIVLINPSYGKNCNQNSSSMWLHSIAEFFCTEFLRNYSISIGIPIGIVWFGNFNEGVRGKEFNYRPDKAIFWLLFICMCVSWFVAALSILAQAGNIVTYGLCNVDTQTKIGVVWATFGLSLIQVIIWIVVYFLFKGLTKHNEVGKTAHHLAKDLVDIVKDVVKDIAFISDGSPEDQIDDTVVRRALQHIHNREIEAYEGATGPTDDNLNHVFNSKRPIPYNTTQEIRNRTSFEEIEIEE